MLRGDGSRDEEGQRRGRERKEGWFKLVRTSMGSVHWRHSVISEESRRAA